MKKSDELKLEIKAKREEVEKFQQEGEMAKAVKAAEELNAMADNLQIVLAKEKTDFENFIQNAQPLASAPAMDKTKIYNRAFNKLLFNRLRDDPKPLTDEERATYYNVTGSPGAPGQIESVDTRGGVLVSPEQIKTLQEFRQSYVALKDYVSVVSTNTTSGRWPIMPVQNLTFEPFVEMTDVAETDVSFTEATYTIADYGLIIPISNQLIDDAEIDVISVIGRQLAEASVKTENQKILEPLNTLITGNTATGITAATTISTYKALNTAIFKTLDGVYEPASKIYVNQDTFLWLANLDDGQNRPLFQPDVAEPNKYRFRGKEVVVIPNTTLPNTTSGSDTYAPIFVGDMKSYLTFFERKGFELSASREYLWRKYAYALMGIIRFGVVVTDPYSMVALKVKL